MLSELVQALVQSQNEAADEVLLEALQLGNDAEKSLALNALLRRRSLRGLSGVVAAYEQLPQPAQMTVLKNIRIFHPALRECGRGRDSAAALSAMKLIALGRQGRLTYVLSDGLHNGDEAVARAAVEAMVALARWVSTETRKLQRTDPALPGGGEGENPAAATYRQIIEERGEIEQAVARAMDVHRGKHGPDLLRAALLLADWPGSRTLAILETPKHSAQNAMIRRLQQAPDSEHVDAFLLGASHGGLRTHFGTIFSHIAEPPVLDALLRRTHWLKDQQLQICMHQVTRGVWWVESDLERDLGRRDDDDTARIGEWVAASGAHDVVQDERLERLRTQVSHYLPGRLRLLRIAMRRPKNTSAALLQSFLKDPDERLLRMAVREILRRRPVGYENMLLGLMTSAPESVRRVISRSVGKAGFDQYWERFDHLDKATRKAAGRAMMKILPEGVQRLGRRLRGGTMEERLKAILMTQELGLADALSGVLFEICQDSHPKLRSKAVALLAELKVVPPDLLLEKVLKDSDARVRANAIEVLEAKHRIDFVPLLAERARSGTNRERANAIKALSRMRVSTASSQLANMMRDERAEHRISALWALRQIGWWRLLNDVGQLAKGDPSLRVRRYAMNVLRGVSEALQAKGKTG